MIKLSVTEQDKIGRLYMVKVNGCYHIEVRKDKGKEVAHIIAIGFTSYLDILRIWRTVESYWPKAYYLEIR